MAGCANTTADIIMSPHAGDVRLQHHRGITARANAAEVQCVGNRRAPVVTSRANVFRGEYSLAQLPTVAGSKRARQCLLTLLMRAAKRPTDAITRQCIWRCGMGTIV